MAWETKGGRRYFYRSIREGKRVKKVYLGTEETAEELAAILSARRIEEQERSQREQVEREDRLALERRLLQYQKTVQKVVSAFLRAAGYHQHHQGEWRKRRETTVASKGLIASETIPEETMEQIATALQKAQQGDEEGMALIREVMSAYPQILEAWNLSRVVEEGLMQAAHGKDLAAREATRRYLDLQRAQLKESASPLESLLIDRIVHNLLDLLSLEAQSQRKQKALSPAQAEFHQRQIDRAHARYMSAIKTLASVRKLALPSVQVNVAEKQINVNQMQVASAARYDVFEA